MTETRRRRWPFVVGGLAILLVAGTLLFQWDWLLPMVNRAATAAAGRDVRVTHLRVQLGRITHVELDGVTIANPADWTGGDPPFGTIEQVVADVDAMAYLRNRAIVVPALKLTRPTLSVVQLADPKAPGSDTNYAFGTKPAGPAAPPPSTAPGTGPQIGTLTIEQGEIHTKLARLNADFVVQVHTEGDKLIAAAKGTYAKQPITAQATGGALLSLRDAATPYPIEATLANGSTKLSLKGTVQDPLSFSGANLRLDLAGPDMALLLPLTGVAIPKTPPYRVAGQFDYTDEQYVFKGIQGKVGTTDLEGDLKIDTKPTAEKGRPVITATLASRLVDLKDLGGFIGAEPGDAAKGTKRPVASNGRVLPDEPISLPRLNAADVHLTYRAARIQGRSQPLDTMQAKLDIVNGAVELNPLSFGIGGGQITSVISLSEAGKGVKARATIDFQRVSVDKLLASTGVARGAGNMGGRAVIDGAGQSLAQILATGNGEFKLYMGAGGNVSALLVDLSGLQFGNALLSALGLPTRARIQCFVSDFVLQRGVATARTVVLDTDENRVVGTGALSFATEQLKFVLNTDAKHFSVGTLPAPINISGSLANPSVAPDAAELGLRAGAAVGLGIALTPLAALLPTIQLGIGEDGACASLLRQGKTPPKRR